AALGSGAGVKEGGAPRVRQPACRDARPAQALSPSERALRPCRSLGAGPHRGQPLRMISVVIPTYNASRWLGASLDSILTQSEPPGEVVVVDDGSTDDSRDVLAAYRDRVEVVSGEHGGLAAARNLGLRVARGDWIAFQDADDIALPDRLARLQAHPAPTARAPPARPGGGGAVFADGASLGNGGRIVPRGLAVRAAGRRLGAADLFDGFPAYYQSALVARDALEAAGPFDPSYRIHPDHDHA